jgi:elongation factor P
MNLTDYEQMELDVEFIGDKIDLLRENDEVILEMYDEKPIGIQLPNTLIFEVSETEAVVKGQTAASSNKPAVLENGLRVMVPPFIEQGEKVIINTEDLTYLKRAE